MSYLDDAEQDAKNTIIYDTDTIIDRLMEGKQASGDIDETYHFERHIDRWYSLVEAAEVLADCRKHAETDSGLWQSLDPQEAVRAQAQYTYGNAVAHFYRQFIEQINVEIESLAVDLEKMTDQAEERRDELEWLNKHGSTTLELRERKRLELTKELDSEEAVEGTKREAIEEMINEVEA